MGNTSVHSILKPSGKMEDGALSRTACWILYSEPQAIICRCSSMHSLILLSPFVLFSVQDLEAVSTMHVLDD